MDRGRGLRTWIEEVDTLCESRKWIQDVDTGRGYRKWIQEVDR